MSIFPFIDAGSSDTTETDSTLPLFKEYAYDYKENKLLLDENNKTYLVEGNEALRIWIYKALSTARFRYTAYSAAFGNEVEDNIIGQVIDTLSEDILLSELERYIIEALMVNPYIEELSNIKFELSGSGTNTSFDCKTLYGTENITFFMEGVSI